MFECLPLGILDSGTSLYYLECLVAVSGGWCLTRLLNERDMVVVMRLLTDVSVLSS